MEIPINGVIESMSIQKGAGPIEEDEKTKEIKKAEMYLFQEFFNLANTNQEILDECIINLKCKSGNEYKLTV